MTGAAGLVSIEMIVLMSHSSMIIIIMSTGGIWPRCHFHHWSENQETFHGRNLDSGS